MPHSLGVLQTSASDLERHLTVVLFLSSELTFLKWPRQELRALDLHYSKLQSRENFILQDISGVLITSLYHSTTLMELISCGCLPAMVKTQRETSHFPFFSEF